MPAFELQKLVQSLDPPEKRRFKEINVDSAQFISLFDDLKDSLLSCESDFVKQFQHREYLKKPEKFSSLKNYLLNAILDAMRYLRQHSGADKSAKHLVPEWIADVEFLQKKMLYKLRDKRLKKVEKEARKYELYEDLLKILRIKGRVLIADQHPNYLDETEKNSDEITRTIFIIQNKYALLSLRNQLFLRVRENSKIRQEGQLHDLAEVMKAPLLQNIQQALSFDACLNFHFSHALFHQTKWELKQALYHHEQIYLKWKSNPQFQKYRATDYRNSLNNYLGLCNAEHQFEHFAEALIALEKPPFQSKDEEAEARQNGLFVRLQHWITKCKWEDAIKVEDTFQKEQTLIGKKLTTSRRMAFSMSFSWLCLIVGDLEGAIKWNEDLLALGTQAVRIDLRRYALLFALIIHFELGNVDQLDNRYRAALRAYKKDELELQYEKMVLKFLLKLQKVPVGEMLQSLLLELRGNLSGLLNLPEERNALGFEFTMQWVASKVEKCSLKCILEKNI